MTGGQQPNAGGEFGGHIDDLLACGDKVLSDGCAAAGGAFDGPAPVRPTPAGRDQVAASDAVGWEGLLMQHPSALIEHGNRD